MDFERHRQPIRVAVAAPFPQIVGIHGRAAEYADEIELCGAISDATRVLEQARRLQPEVLLLSEELGVDDAAFFTELNTAAPMTRLVVMVDGDPDAKRSFADAVVRRDAAAGELHAAIVSAARRQHVAMAPPAHSRAAGGFEEAPEREARWFAEMHGEAATGRAAVALADPESPQSATLSEAEQTSSSATLPEEAREARGVPIFRLPHEPAATDGDTVRHPDVGGAATTARVVLVFSGKGGVGKSIVATNLATALAGAGARVALVDLNLQYGDAGVLLHLESHATTIDAVAAATSDDGRLEPGILDSALAVTPEGVRVLLAPRSPESADLVGAADLGAILTELSRHHDYVVVDSPAHLEERILGVMEVADHVLLVTSASITAVKDTKTTLRLLQSLGIEPGRVAVVLNQTHARVSFTPEDIAGALRFPLLASLPFEPRMDGAIDSGRPLVTSEPRSRFSKQLRLVVDHLREARAASAGQAPRPQPARWRLRFGGR